MAARRTKILGLVRLTEYPLTQLWAGNLGGLIGSVALVCWPLPGGLLDLIVEEVLGDGRVSAGGGV